MVSEVRAGVQLLLGESKDVAAKLDLQISKEAIANPVTTANSATPDQASSTNILDVPQQEIEYLRCLQAALPSCAEKAKYAQVESGCGDTPLSIYCA